MFRNLRTDLFLGCSVGSFGFPCLPCSARDTALMPTQGLKDSIVATGLTSPCAGRFDRSQVSAAHKRSQCCCHGVPRVFRSFAFTIFHPKPLTTSPLAKHQALTLAEVASAGSGSVSEQTVMSHQRISQSRGSTKCNANELSRSCMPLQ